MVETRLTGRWASIMALLVFFGVASLASGFVPQSGVCVPATFGTASDRVVSRSSSGSHGRWNNNEVSKARKISSKRQTTMLALPAVATTAAVIKAAILTGPHIKGVAALTAVSALAVVPLTLVRQAYSFSVGYGASVAAMSLALIRSFGVEIPLSSSAVTAPALLAYGGVLYGIRLASFLFLREISVPSKKEQIKKLDRTSPPSRVPFATAVAMFYAFMMSPVLYALRAQATGEPLSCLIGLCPSKLMQNVQWAGVGLAYLGLGLETVADHHKFMVKRQYDFATSFVGPTGGLYALCRHPNYLGEILFWAGIYLGGSISFGKSIAAWVFGSLGLWGIVSIMKGATKRLDEKQADRYENQLAYISWKKDVKAPLVPFVKD